MNDAVQLSSYKYIIFEISDTYYKIQYSSKNYISIIIMTLYR